MNISVNSKPDGTFTLSCGTDTVILGARNIQKSTSSPIKPGRRARAFQGGFVVSHAVAGTSVPHGAIQVRDADKLIAKLKAEVSAPNIARTSGHTTPTELHFSLKGLHSPKVGGLLTITDGHSSFIEMHIQFDRHYG